MVQDTIPPVIVIPAQDSINECGPQADIGLIGWYSTAGGAVVTDDGVVTFSADLTLLEVQMILESSTDTLCGGTMNVGVVFVAVDDCGNSSAPMPASYTIEDTVDPVITQDATMITVECTENAENDLISWLNSHGGAQAEDECADSVVWTSYIWTDSNGNNGIGTFNSPPYIPIDRSKCDWDVNVSFLVVDGCGNLAITTGSFEIFDTLSPAFEMMPNDTIVDCHLVPDPTPVRALDACDGLLTLTFSESNTQLPDTTLCQHYAYQITRSWSATDACGYSISQERSIQLIDTLAPSLVPPDAVTVECHLIDSLSITGIPTDVSDFCGSLTITYSDSIVGSGCSFEIIRKWKAIDPCGNATEVNQQMTIEDNTAPFIITPAVDISIECDSLLNVPATFNDWLADMGDALVDDGCESFQSFAAIPGSYNINDQNTFPGNHPGELDPISCPSALPGFIRYENVDFVFYDDCGNASVTSANFGILDTILPSITSCVDTIWMTTADGLCDGLFTGVPPDVEDNCGSTTSPLTFVDNDPIASSDPGNNEQIVDSVFLKFGPFNINTTQATGNVSLTISLNSMDSDDPSEYFFIIDEEGNTLDITPNTLSQCGDTTLMITTITATQINDWARDGYIDILLAPNMPGGSGVLGINDVCIGSSISSTLEFDVDIISPLSYEVSLDGGKRSILSPSMQWDTLLSEGIHNVQHIFRDCADNESYCTQVVVVNDEEVPSLICQSDVSMFTDDENCSVSFQLSTDIDFSDNCGGSLIYNQSLPLDTLQEFIEFSLNSSTGTYIANNVIFNFESVSPLIYSDSDPVLKVILNGDINDIGENFEVLGEDGNILGETVTSPLCDQSSILLQPIALSKFNLWAIDGTITLALLSNIDPTVEGGGINPCIPIAQDGTDGISKLRAELSYSDASPYYFSTGATIIADTDFPSNGGNPSLNFNVGETDVFYVVEDSNNNRDTCQYRITVVDDISPIVRCKNTVIFIHPDGLQEYFLSQDEVIESVSDNCEIDSISLFPTVFSCDDISSTVIVSIKVWDSSGNIDSCDSQLKIDPTVIIPTFSVGICQGDTLQLFANVPPSVPNAYSFSWTGPQNFMSNLENPFILNPNATYSGTYTVEVEGFGGCISVGNVEVLVEQLVTPEISTDLTTICQSEDLLLQATNFTGSVTYGWYEGLFPNGILLQTTPGPSLLLNPTAGQHFYYVIVESTSCETNPSTEIEINVIQEPGVSVQNSFITICEEEDLQLGTDEFDPAYDYSWTGPDNYSSDGQFPNVIENISIINQGDYSLVISVGSCVSDTAVVNVVVFDRPETPIISGETIYCQGNSVVFTVNNVPSADLYTWYHDDVFFSSTSSNNLVIPGALNNLSGEWTVVTTQGICISELSSEHQIIVEDEILIGASNSGPVCVGDSVQLSSSFIPSSMYQWESPSGIKYNSQNPFVVAEEGLYSLTVTTTTGCESTTETEVNLDEAPTITALSSDAMNCTDGATSVTFFPSIVPAGSFTYEWIGPNNFSSDELNPTIDNFTSNQNGNYVLIAYNEQCPSEAVAIEINVSDIPAIPSILGGGLYCQDDEIMLSTIELIGEVKYNWETPAGQVTLTTNDFDVASDASLLNDGFYILTTEIDGCVSPPSDTFWIDVVESPPAPQIAGRAVLCEGDSLKLFVSDVAGANYTWFFNGQDIFNDSPQLLIMDVDEFVAGDYTVMMTLGTCISPISSVYTVEISPQPQTPMITLSNISFCIDDNSSLDICIDPGTITPGATYTFDINGTEINTQDNCITVMTSDPIVQIGTNEVSVTTDSGTCFSEVSSILEFQASMAPSEVAMIIDDLISVCEESNAILAANVDIGASSISWSSPDGDIIFLDPEGTETGMTGLSLGENTIILSLDFMACKAFSSDTAIVILEDFPIAEDDLLNVNYNSSDAINVVDNDFTSSAYSVEIVEEPLWGTIEINGDIVTYTADPRFSGITSFTYRLCSIECPDNCDIATVIVEIGLEENCFAPSIITPNGDGHNDAFVIPCLSGSDNNSEVKIFNQYGDEVYGASPYENDWEGTYQGSDLPSGTYFYVINFGNGTKDISGFLIIER